MLPIHKPSTLKRLLITKRNVAIIHTLQDNLLLVDLAAWFPFHFKTSSTFAQRGNENVDPTNSQFPASLYYFVMRAVQVYRRYSDLSSTCLKCLNFTISSTK